MGWMLDANIVPFAAPRRGIRLVFEIEKNPFTPLNIFSILVLQMASDRKQMKKSLWFVAERKMA